MVVKSSKPRYFLIVRLVLHISLLCFASFTALGSGQTVSVRGKIYHNSSVVREYPQSLLLQHDGGRSFVLKSDLSAADCALLGISPSAGSAGQADVAAQPESPDGSSKEVPSLDSLSNPKPVQAVFGEPLTPMELSAIVTISDESSAGTGFLCRFEDRIWLVTNQHVLAGMKDATFRSQSGERIKMLSLRAAANADLALVEIQTMPAGVHPLELLENPEANVRKDDAVCIPGNSKGDGVVTQTHGKLLALGPEKIETDCPVYSGNSGSPIIHRGSGKVVGVLTEALLYNFDSFDKASFKNKDSAIKSEIRYFGYRLDNVPSWHQLDWMEFQAHDALIRKSQQELEWIAAYFTGSSDSFKAFKDLHSLHNEAIASLERGDLALSEQVNERKRFVWSVEGLIKRSLNRATTEISRNLRRQRLPSFIHQKRIDDIKAMSEQLAGGVEIVRRDDQLIAELISRGF